MNATTRRLVASAAVIAIASTGLTWAATADTRERVVAAQTLVAYPTPPSPVSGDHVRGLHAAAKSAGARVVEWSAQSDGAVASWEVTLRAGEPEVALRALAAGLGRRWGAWSLSAAGVDMARGELWVRAVTYAGVVG